LASDVSYDEYREERSYSPSFDCKKATTPDEDLICSDEALSALDVQVAATYKKVLSATKDKAALKATHQDWIKNEHQICSSKECLTNSYQKRLVALSNPDWLRTWSPNFDCTKATTPDEKLVCSDEVLSALDVQVADAYKKTLKLTQEKAFLRETHQAWIKNEHQLCATKACLMQSYQRRLTELSNPDWLKKWSPSFDCNAANTPDESLICSDETLSALDVQMAEAYKRVLSLTSDREALKATQIDWIKNDRELCSSKYCLMNSYQKRLVALSNPAWTYVRVPKTQENSVDYVTEYQKRMNNVND
jgi:uncharacterized protein